MMCVHHHNDSAFNGNGIPAHAKSGHDAWGKKLVIKGQILYDSTQRRSLENLQAQDRKEKWFGIGKRNTEWIEKFILGRKFWILLIMMDVSVTEPHT